MLPKSLAVISPRRFSQFVGPPMALAVNVLSPVLPIVKVANTMTRRLIWPGFVHEKDLDVSDIERAIELGTGDAALAARERAALRQLVQLASTRVDEWMLPRSHLQLQRLPIDAGILASGIPTAGYILIAEQEGEEIIASIGVRTLRPSQIDDLASAAEPVIYVPWSATVADTFDALQASDRAVAAIVNEYGDTVGVLTIDVILEGILRLHSGRPPESGSDNHFEIVSPGIWRVNGMMSVRRLSEQLGAPPPEGRNVTIAGLIQEENGRLTRIGDTCRWDRFLLEVVESSGRGQVRIEIRDSALGEVSE
jgi:CBS domain containing-hemolysin-like protein